MMEGEKNLRRNGDDALTPFSPGSVVRVARQPPGLAFRDQPRAQDLQQRTKWPKCRATVATVSETSATIIWDDWAVSPPQDSWFQHAGEGSDGADGEQRQKQPRKRRGRRLPRTFLVAPDLEKTKQPADDVQEEEEVPLSSLEALLPFETENGDRSFDKTPSEFKEQGDALLRLGDYSAAITRFEAALALTSTYELGSTIVLNDGTGRTILAEIDCIEDDDKLDITLVDNGEEKTIDASKQVLLSLIENDVDRIQERILLNLSRCLLKLADLDSDNIRATKNRKSTVLGCTLAMSCTSFGGALEGTVEKARLIRSRAYVELGRSKHAKADAKIVLKSNPDSTQAKKLLRDIERHDAQKKKTDKKLARDVCKWVDKATNASTEDGGNPVSEAENEKCSSSSESEATKISASHLFWQNQTLLHLVILLFLSVAVKLWMNAYQTLQQ